MLHDTHPAGVSSPDAERKLPLHWTVDRDTIDLQACLFLFRLFPAAAMHVARVELRYNFLPHVVQSVTCWSALGQLAERRLATPHAGATPTATPAIGFYPGSTPGATPGVAAYRSGTRNTLLRIMMRELRRHEDMPHDMVQLRADLNWQARGCVVMCIAAYRRNSRADRDDRVVETPWFSKDECGSPLHHNSRYRPLHPDTHHSLIYTHIHIYTHSLIYTHIYTRVHTCTHAHIHTHTHLSPTSVTETRDVWAQPFAMDDRELLLRLCAHEDLGPFVLSFM